MAGYQPELYAGKNCAVAYRRRGCYPETGVQMVTFRRIFGHGVRVRHLACRNISEGPCSFFGCSLRVDRTPVCREEAVQRIVRKEAEGPGSIPASEKR